MRGAALFVFGCIRLAAQQASIEGVASDALSHAPLAGVHVRLSLSRSGHSVAYGAMSGRTGHFSILTIAPGTYDLTPEHAGHVYLGTKTVALKAGESVTDFKLEMTPQAVISGHILDDNGDPLRGISIEVVPAVDKPLAEQLQVGPTDDRGEFRVRGAPGKYYVQAFPPSGLEVDGANGAGDAVLVATWFPNATSKDRATVVEAAAGRETGGVDIHLARQIGLSISGVVTGLPETTLQPMVTADGADNRSHRMVALGPDRKFTFTGLAAGTYRLMAMDPGGLEARRVSVTLDHADVKDVELSVQAPEQMSGTLEMPGDRTRLAVVLEPVSGSDFAGGTTQGGDVDKNGAFVIGGIFPRVYYVDVSPLPGNSYIAEVRLDGAIVNGTLDLSGGVRGSKLKVAVSPDGGEISGTVDSADGVRLTNARASVFLTGGANDRNAVVADDGTYSIHGIRPGKYRLVAIENYRGLDDLKAVEDKALEIEIKSGDRMTKDLRLR